MRWYSENKDTVIISLSVLVALLVIGICLYFLFGQSQPETKILIQPVTPSEQRSSDSITTVPTVTRPVPISIPIASEQRSISVPNTVPRSIGPRQEQRPNTQTQIQRQGGQQGQQEQQGQQGQQNGLGQRQGTNQQPSGQRPMQVQQQTSISNPSGQRPNDINVANTINVTLSAYEQELFTRVNDYRKSKGLTALTIDDRLVRAAENHNNLMVEKNMLSHQLSGELPLAEPGPNNDRYDRVNYNWRYAAENVAAGYRTPEDVMTGWINSPGHNANILSTKSKNIGVAHNPNGNYWTQTFGSE